MSAAVSSRQSSTRARGARRRQIGVHRRAGEEREREARRRRALGADLPAHQHRLGQRRSWRCRRPTRPRPRCPLLSTSSGRTPANCGHHSTASASLPGSSEPTCARQAVRDRRVDRDLGQVAQHALVVAGPVLAAAHALHRVGVLQRAPVDLADPAHPLRVRREHRDHAEVVQHALGRHRLRPHAPAQRGPVAGAPAGGEHVHRGDHRQVLGLRAGAERDGGGGRGGEHALAAGERQQVRRVPAAAALDVERVDRAAAERRERVLDRERLVEAVGVDRELDVVAVGEVERAADLLRPGARRPRGSSARRRPRAARRSTGLGAGRGRAHQQHGVDGMGLERRPGRGESLGGVVAEVPDGP